MSAAKLKLQAVLVAWHNLRMAVEDANERNDSTYCAILVATDKLRDRLEELEAIVGAETPANLFDLKEEMIDRFRNGD
jgi:hypothetical protein